MFPPPGENKADQEGLFSPNKMLFENTHLELHSPPSLPPFLPTPLFHLTQLGHPWPGKLPWLLPLEQALAATLCSSPTIAWGGQAVEKASPLVLKYATKICMVLV